MERLTYWCGDGAGGGEWRINADGKEYSGPEVDRLAAYENTGQEPGDVLSATDMGKIACALHELNQYKELGTLDRLRGAVENLADAEARAEEAEAALAAAVRGMEAMALTIRRRTDYDTECCPFCHYDCPVEDYCPGWEGEECFRWRGADRSRKPTGDLSRDATKMVHGVWISVENRLPHLREDVLVCAYWNEKWGVYSGWTNGKRWYVGCGCGTVSGIQVSHWMPLPLPPERSGSVDELE